MTIYEVLTTMFGNGPFTLPTAAVIQHEDIQIRTAGSLSGTINKGTIIFSDPKPKAKAMGCIVTLEKIEPASPDAAIVTADMLGVAVRKRIVIGDA